MTRPPKSTTGFIKVRGSGVAAAEVHEEAPVTPEVRPEPVVVEVVEQAAAPEPSISEQTRREMEEGRRMLDKFK